MSPYGLVQERVSRDLHFPWRVLVCCAFMTRTTKEQARPALSAFFAWWHHPVQFGMHVRPSVLRNLLTPLGLVNRREELLVRMAADYLEGSSPYECFGVGEYARDALDLFCGGVIPSGQISDHYLNAYATWRGNGGSRIKWDEAGYLDFVVAKAQQ